jgi:hypothetical protein
LDTSYLLRSDIVGVTCPDGLGLIEDVVLSSGFLDLLRLRKTSVFRKCKGSDCANLLLLLLVLIVNFFNLGLVAILLLRLLFIILDLLLDIHQLISSSHIDDRH